MLAIRILFFVALASCTASSPVTMTSPSPVPLWTATATDRAACAAIDVVGSMGSEASLGEEAESVAIRGLASRRVAESISDPELRAAVTSVGMSLRLMTSGDADLDTMDVTPEIRDFILSERLPDELVRATERCARRAKS